MSDRKKDHIDLAFKSQIDKVIADSRFNYEPLLGKNPYEADISTNFLDKTMKIPVWISSMTGGTAMAEKINTNLARACNEFGMGMGLGSCRILLDNDNYLPQFNVRHIIGDKLPLYANLGIAQIEKILKNGEIEKIQRLIYRLQADGLIVHVNPLQEYLQPEGDVITISPAETIQQLYEATRIKIIVKEVGQGMGPASIKKLMESEVAGIELGALGGTNFAKVELMRSDATKQELLAPLANLGHTANEMVDILNKLYVDQKTTKKQLIISGGIKNFLDGYYFIQKSKFPAVYGQASMFLKYAMDDYETLRKYIEFQVKGLKIAYTYLTLKEQ